MQVHTVRLNALFWSRNASDVTIRYLLRTNKCNKEMNKLLIWFRANELQINSEKSSIIVIPSKLNAQAANLSIFYDECPINCFETSKYLGVNLDNKLNFKSHICIIENKVARSVGILSKLRYLFPSSALLLLYYSLIHPHLLFSLPLWGNANQSYLNRLQRLQNKAIRIITDSKLRMSSNQGRILHACKACIACLVI